jgi:hypothetical protein
MPRKLVSSGSYLEPEIGFQCRYAFDCNELNCFRSKCKNLLISTGRL